MEAPDRRPIPRDPFDQVSEALAIGGDIQYDAADDLAAAHAVEHLVDGAQRLALDLDLDVALDRETDRLRQVEPRADVGAAQRDFAVDHLADRDRQPVAIASGHADEAAGAARAQRAD